MVPAIFKRMEAAEDSDGFDSCEEDENIGTEGLQALKRTGNPFTDFNVDILAVEERDPNEASKFNNCSVY
jgi:hypothetical protein